MKEKEYVDNDVWVYRIELKENGIQKTIYTKSFPEYYRLSETEKDKYEDSYNYWDQIEKTVKEKYFTKERIQEYKDYFCKLIQESDNPFNIVCIDQDGGYNVTEDQLFNIDN